MISKIFVWAKAAKTYGANNEITYAEGSVLHVLLNLFDVKSRIMYKKTDYSLLCLLQLAPVPVTTCTKLGVSCNTPIRS